MPDASELQHQWDSAERLGAAQARGTRREWPQPRNTDLHETHTVTSTSTLPEPPGFSDGAYKIFFGLVVSLLAGMAAFIVWVIVSVSTAQVSPPGLAAPRAPIQAGEVEGGWTQVGGGTRLQYVDLQDNVRCYRMRYSSEMSCIQIQQ